MEASTVLGLHVAFQEAFSISCLSSYSLFYPALPLLHSSLALLHLASLLSLYNTVFYFHFRGQSTSPHNPCPGPLLAT